MSGEERHADKIRRIADDGTEYHCEAYGPDSSGLCFCEVSGGCSSRAMCERRMMQERMILWVRLNALEQAGDETAKFVLDSVSSPWQLLNGDLAAEEETDQE